MSMFVLILHTWAFSVMKFHFRSGLLGNVTLISGILFFLAFICGLFGIVYGVLWYNDSMGNVFLLTEVIVLLICGVGYIFYGKEIISTLKNSGNQSPSRLILPIKDLSLENYSML